MTLVGSPGRESAPNPLTTSRRHRSPLAPQSPYAFPSSLPVLSFFLPRLEADVQLGRGRASLHLTATNIQIFGAPPHPPRPLIQTTFCSINLTGTSKDDSCPQQIRDEAASYCADARVIPGSGSGRIFLPRRTHRPRQQAQHTRAPGSHGTQQHSHCVPSSQY